ncbi:MAG: hypothetical protein WC729_29320 [Sphingomonas sp.]|jgi:hypothetical protein|uniref:hypothetical protein n=1 Tax=Sphingomonas sp. TaxID=28214 RepID=UPI00356686D6
MRPVILSSPLTFVAVVGDVKGPSDPSALQCPEGTAMLVDEIRVHSDYQLDRADFSFSLGRAKMTNGYLPPSLIARHENPSKSTAGYFWNSTGGVMVWRFPRPLFVPRGRSITISGVSTVAAARTFYVSFKARILEEGAPEPAVVAVPYVSAFYPAAPATALDAADTTTVRRSVTGELGNPFAVPLHVRSFLGWSDIGLTGGYDRYAYITLQTCIQRYYAQMQISDWNGNPLVRTKTRLSHLCSSKGSNEWALPFDIPAGKSLYAVMDETHPVVAGRISLRPGISINGWRNVPISEVK